MSFLTLVLFAVAAAAAAAAAAASHGPTAMTTTQPLSVEDRMAILESRVNNIEEPGE
jgi:ABC-type glycerol-3-phosphate transport system substrate-binding protein